MGGGLAIPSKLLSAVFILRVSDVRSLMSHVATPAISVEIRNQKIRKYLEFIVNQMFEFLDNSIRTPLQLSFGQMNILGQLCLN